MRRNGDCALQALTSDRWRNGVLSRNTLRFIRATLAVIIARIELKKCMTARLDPLLRSCRQKSLASEISAKYTNIRRKCVTGIPIGYGPINESDRRHVGGTPTAQCRLARENNRVHSLVPIRV